MEGIMKKAYLSAIAYSFIIGFSFMFSKITVVHSSPITALAHRFLVAAVVFFAYRVITQTKSTLTKKDFKKLLPLSLSYPIGYFLIQALALNQISSGEVGILFSVSPAFALIIASVFINENSTFLQKSGVFISIFGVVFMFAFSGVSFSTSNVWGYVLALLAAVIFAIYNTHARVTLKNYSFVEVTEVLLYIGALFFNIIVIFDPQNYFEPFTNTQYLLAILYIGVIASIFASLSATYALTSIKASQLTIFSNLATLISILAGVIFLGETTYWYHYIAAGLIITGVLLANKEKAQTN